LTETVVTALPLDELLPEELPPLEELPLLEESLPLDEPPLLEEPLPLDELPAPLEELLPVALPELEVAGALTVSRGGVHAASERTRAMRPGHRRRTSIPFQRRSPARHVRARRSSRAGWNRVTGAAFPPRIRVARA
jgi:hypothetical protein